MHLILHYTNSYYVGGSFNYYWLYHQPDNIMFQTNGSSRKYLVDVVLIIERSTMLVWISTEKSVTRELIKLINLIISLRVTSTTPTAVTIVKPIIILMLPC